MIATLLGRCSFRLDPSLGSLEGLQAQRMANRTTLQIDGRLPLLYLPRAQLV